MKKQSGFWVSTGIALTCTALLWGWRALFGKVNGLLFLSVIHHGVRNTFPDGQAWYLLALYAAFYGCKWMVQSLQKDTLRHSAALIWKTVSETPMLPPA
jgi:hypothetical protein